MSDIISWARSNQADFLLRDFYTFAKHSGMCPDITEEEHRAPCDWLESRLPQREKRFSRRFGIFLMPRLTYKSSLIQALCGYSILQEYHTQGKINTRIVLGRSTTALSEASLYGIKTHIEHNPILAAAFGNLRPLFDAWASEQITANQRESGLREPTIDTTGLNTSKTGNHPDLVILDDLVNEQNYQSAADMQRARLLVQAYDPIIERWGSLLLVGTRWGDNDVYGWALDQDDRREDAGQPRKWDRYIVGAYTDEGDVRFPTVLPEQRIVELRGSVEPKLFSAWILNEARAEGETIFTLSRIQYVDIDYLGGMFSEISLEDTPSNAPYLKKFGSRVPLGIVMLVDPAPTVGVHSDYTGICVVGFDPDANYWVLCAMEVKKLPTERLELLLRLAHQYQPGLLALENADLDAPLLESRLREQGLRTRVVSFNPRQDRRRITADPKLMPHGRTSKAAQIEAIEPTLNAGRIFFSRHDCQPLVRQLLHYPYLDHDDVIDAFSMSRAYEGRREVRAESDPLRILALEELREYALEGLNPDGTEEGPYERAGGSAGLSSARI